MSKKNIVIVKCKVCFHLFPRMNKRFARSSRGLGEKIRSVNCVTCSRKCSKELNRVRQKK
jgi:hypothetical protein